MNATHTVNVYRIDTGARVQHLTRAYACAGDAAAAALAINCKAYTPFMAFARSN